MRFHESICAGESTRSSVCESTRRLNACPTELPQGAGSIIDLGLGEVRLERHELPHHLLILDVVHILVVSGDVNEQRDLQLFHLIQR